MDDPCTIKPGSGITEAAIPDVKYVNIYNYLISTPSPFNKEELKAYMCLKGYKYLLAGWVGDVYYLHVLLVMRVTR